MLVMRTRPAALELLLKPESYASTLLTSTTMFEAPVGRGVLSSSSLSSRIACEGEGERKAVVRGDRKELERRK